METIKSDLTHSHQHTKSIVRERRKAINVHIPVIEHNSRRVGAFPEYWLIMPWL